MTVRWSGIIAAAAFIVVNVLTCEQATGRKKATGSEPDLVMRNVSSLQCGVRRGSLAT
jgi:hypothetical protein